MGRIGRQRKYKQVDPSYGGGGTHARVRNISDSHCDLAPKNELDQSSLPRKMKRMLTMKRVASGKIGKSKNKTVDQKIKKAKMQEKLDLRIKPGESKTQFLDRLDQEVDKALNAAMMETKKMRQSRKSHLKKRDEKLKLRKAKPAKLLNEKRNQPLNQGPEVKNYADVVRFGEVVDEPPQILMIPRKASSKKISSSNTKIATLLGKGRVKDSSDELPTDDEIKLTEQKAMLDEERNKMIVEYRKLKPRKTLSKLRSLHPLQT